VSLDIVRFTLRQKLDSADSPDQVLGDLIDGPSAPLAAEMSPDGSGWVEFEDLTPEELSATREWLASRPRLISVGEYASPIRSFEIDGDRFEDLGGFYDEIGRQLLGGASWGRNLDAFNDILRGDFGPLPERFRIIWRHAFVSKEKLRGTGSGSFLDLLDLVGDHENVELILD
jgi:RNAse (barnase) inhibitor barstar